jgi:hypothetical protein
MKTRKRIFKTKTKNKNKKTNKLFNKIGGATGIGFVVSGGTSETLVLGPSEKFIPHMYVKLEVPPNSIVPHGISLDFFIKTQHNVPISVIESFLQLKMALKTIGININSLEELNKLFPNMDILQFNMLLIANKSRGDLVDCEQSHRIPYMRELTLNKTTNKFEGRRSLISFGIKVDESDTEGPYAANVNMFVQYPRSKVCAAHKHRIVVCMFAQLLEHIYHNQVTILEMSQKYYDEKSRVETDEKKKTTLTKFASQYKSVLSEIERQPREFKSRLNEGSVFIKNTRPYIRYIIRLFSLIREKKTFSQEDIDDFYLNGESLNNPWIVEVRFSELVPESNLSGVVISITHRNKRVNNRERGTEEPMSMQINYNDFSLQNAIDFVSFFAMGFLNTGFTLLYLYLKKVLETFFINGNTIFTLDPVYLSISGFMHVPLESKTVDKCARALSIFQAGYGHDRNAHNIAKIKHNDTIIGMNLGIPAGYDAYFNNKQIAELCYRRTESDEYKILVSFDISKHSTQSKAASSMSFVVQGRIDGYLPEPLNLYDVKYGKRTLHDKVELIGCYDEPDYVVGGGLDVGTFHPKMFDRQKILIYGNVTDAGRGEILIEQTKLGETFELFYPNHIDEYDSHFKRMSGGMMASSSASPHIPNSFRLKGGGPLSPYFLSENCSFVYETNNLTIYGGFDESLVGPPYFLSSSGHYFSGEIGYILNGKYIIINQGTEDLIKSQLSDLLKIFLRQYKNKKFKSIDGFFYMAEFSTLDKNNESIYKELKTLNLRRGRPNEIYIPFYTFDVLVEILNSRVSLEDLKYFNKYGTKKEFASTRLSNMFGYFHKKLGGSLEATVDTYISHIKHINIHINRKPRASIHLTRRLSNTETEHGVNIDGRLLRKAASIKTSRKGRENILERKRFPNGLAHESGKLSLNEASNGNESVNEGGIQSLNGNETDLKYASMVFEFRIGINRTLVEIEEIQKFATFFDDTFFSNIHQLLDSDEDGTLNDAELNLVINFFKYLKEKIFENREYILVEREKGENFFFKLLSYLKKHYRFGIQPGPSDLTDFMTNLAILSLASSKGFFQ